MCIRKSEEARKCYVLLISTSRSRFIIFLLFRTTPFGVDIFTWASFHRTTRFENARCVIALGMLISQITRREIPDSSRISLRNEITRVLSRASHPAIVSRLRQSPPENPVRRGNHISLRPDVIIVNSSSFTDRRVQSLLDSRYVRNVFAKERTRSLTT